MTACFIYPVYGNAAGVGLGYKTGVTPQRILILKDNPATAALATRVATAGVAALKRVDAEPSVLVLLDLILPDING